MKTGVYIALGLALVALVIVAVAFNGYVKGTAPFIDYKKRAEAAKAAGVPDSAIALGRTDPANWESAQDVVADPAGQTEHAPGEYDEWGIKKETLLV